MRKTDPSVLDWRLPPKAGLPGLPSNLATAHGVNSVEHIWHSKLTEGGCQHVDVRFNLQAGVTTTFITLTCQNTPGT